MKNDKNEEEQNLKLEEPKIIENEKKVSTEKIEENKEVSLEINEMDKLINKINFNMCHVKIVILMALYCSVDGYVMIATSLLMPVIDKTWKLTEFEKGFIGGSIFLGFMLGALLVGFVSDRKGRKMAFTLGCILSIFGSTFGFFSKDWIVLSVTNAFVGVGIGISIPSCFSLISEVTNYYSRSVIMSLVWIFFPVGEIMACYVSKHYRVYDYTQENWRNLLMFRIIGVSIRNLP